MLSSAMAFGDAKTLSWQDLLPELDDTLDLSDGIRWGERVRLDLNDKDVRIPGFIVPLEYKESEIVTRFLLVPYFGACIHEPPPPPNQTGTNWKKFGNLFGSRALFPPAALKKTWPPHLIPSARSPSNLTKAATWPPRHQRRLARTLQLRLSWATLQFLRPKDTRTTGL